MFGTLGVPDPARGFLFGLDGVLTQTAKQHAAAWKLMFDEFLTQRAKDTGGTFVCSAGLPCAAVTSSANADVVVGDLAELLDRS